MTVETIAEDRSALLGLTAEIVAAHVSNNSIRSADIPAFIHSVHAALSSANLPPAPEPKRQEPAVPVRQSIKQDYLVCLEDGAKLKILKRYLRSRFGMSPAEYRAKWNLPSDYPMVAPAYAEQRRGLAQATGLGRKKVDGDADVDKAPQKTKRRTEAAVAEGQSNRSAEPVAGATEETTPISMVEQARLATSPEA